MAKLTKRTVDALATTGKDYFVWDDDIPGFGVRVLPLAPLSQKLRSLFAVEPTLLFNDLA
jgi:hypothetical protein